MAPHPDGSGAIVMPGRCERPCAPGAPVLSRWLARWRRDPAREVVVVSREDCHLCEQMLEVVRSVGADVEGLDVSVLDLDVERAEGRVTPEQHARWTTLVPVLLVDGREVAHHRVQPARLRSELRRRVLADRGDRA